MAGGIYFRPLVFIVGIKKKDTSLRYHKNNIAMTASIHPFFVFTF